MSPYNNGRQASHLRPRRALLILDCQAAFFDSDGPIPVSSSLLKSVSQNLSELLPKLRQSGADITWVTTQYERPCPSRPCDGIFTDSHNPDASEALQPDTQDSDAYLSREFQKQHGRNNKFLRGRDETTQLASNISSLVDSRDKILVKNEYSAFSMSNLLMSLRSRMVTELYLAGAHSNVSVFATAADAARHGFLLTVLKDCVLYRNEKRHKTAIEEMEVNLAAESRTSKELLEKLGLSEDRLKNGEEVADEVSGTNDILRPKVDPKLVEKLVNDMSSTNLNDDILTADDSASEDLPQNETPIAVPTMQDAVDAQIPRKILAKPRRSPYRTEDSHETENNQLEDSMANKDKDDSKNHEEDDLEVDEDDSDEQVELLIARTRMQLAMADQKRAKASPGPNSANTKPLSAESLIRRESEDVDGVDNIDGPEKRSKHIPEPISTNNTDDNTLHVQNGLGGPANILSPSKSKDQEDLESKIIRLLELQKRKASMADLRGASRESNNSLSAQSQSNLASTIEQPDKSPELSDQNKHQDVQISSGLHEHLDNLTIEADDASGDDIPIEIPKRTRTISQPQTQSQPIQDSNSNNEGETPGLPPGYSGHKKEKVRVRQKKKEKVTYGPEDIIGEPDDSTSIMVNFLPDELAATAFDRMKREVGWRVMYHRGGEVPRLVAVEGEIQEDGSFPVYRHPADESPPLLKFSPTVAKIREHVEKALKHPVNHVLIQHYRTGQDYISEHSDKTLDIAKGTNIVNVSLGAERVMTLRGKRAAKEGDSTPSATESHEGTERASQKVPLPHNSMFILGLPTNAKWLHAINRDKRPDNIKSDAELAYNGERISLTFRYITTFLSADESLIWGQGATSKTRDTAKPVICGDKELAQKMIYAFGAENQSSDFDWEGTYGAGFDVLHFKKQEPKIYVARRQGWEWDVIESADVDAISSDDLAQLTPSSQSALIALREVGLTYHTEILSQEELELPSFTEISTRMIAPVFVDVDRDRTVVIGRDAILLYLSTYYPSTAFSSISPQRTSDVTAPLNDSSATNSISLHTTAGHTTESSNDISRKAQIPSPLRYAKQLSNLSSLVTLTTLIESNTASYSLSSRTTIRHELQLWDEYVTSDVSLLQQGRNLNLFDWAFIPLLAYLDGIGALGGKGRMRKDEFLRLRRYLKVGTEIESVKGVLGERGREE